MMHTKQEAIATLDELGLHVLDVASIVRVGWSIETAPEGELNGWRVMELYETERGDRAQGVLNGGFTMPGQAAVWLASYLEATAGAP